jgi:hypothetical protein
LVSLMPPASSAREGLSTGVVVRAISATLHGSHEGESPSLPSDTMPIVQTNPELEEFLPKLRAALVRNGISDETAQFICQEILAGTKQSRIVTLEQYQESWIVCHAAEGILTTTEDGSRVAAWLTALATALIEYEDRYIKKHGHMPLNACPPETTDGPTGSA